MGKTGTVHVGEDTYVVGKSRSSPVNVNHEVFRHEHKDGKAYKLFSRRAGETDAALQQRILDDIEYLSKVCSRSHATAGREDGFSPSAPPNGAVLGLLALGGLHLDHPQLLRHRARRSSQLSPPQPHPSGASRA